MEFVWAGEREQKNTQLIYSIDVEESCTKLSVCAVDGFQVYLNGEFCCYGPERTAAGYVRPKNISLRGVRKIEVKVTGYNITMFGCDFQRPFFGAEIYKGDSVAYTTKDFICTKRLDRIVNMPRYSVQRGYAEGHDFSQNGSEELETYPVAAPSLIGAMAERCNYQVFSFLPLGKEKAFSGFEEEKTPWWEKNLPKGEMESYALSPRTPAQAIGYKALDFKLATESTGFLKLEIEAEETTDIYAVFDEILPGGKWMYRRSGCNDFIALKNVKGKRTWIACEPYAFQYLKILYRGKATIKPSLIAYQNDQANFVEIFGDEKVVAVFNAAKNSFCQNAVDIFMDCPGRERAGWLCDSYFTAKSELLFTGKNEIEKAFLDNFLIAKTPDIPEKMLPKCFPSEHRTGTYIPNWAMWYVLELEDYLARTGDRVLIEKAKEKIYGLVDFFKKYFNEYGLLEDLESWVFLEWSICNSDEYIAGVNFPSNMLYARMLEAVAALYNDEALKNQATEMKETIVQLSYDGNFFADNAVRVEGKLVRCDDHVSETCQYYALFMGLKTDENFKRRMMEEFGPLRAENVYPEIGRSNMFIGNYLRFFWLCDEGEYERVMKEMLEYFYAMAQKTGTLWEKDAPTASCNHGFASVAAVLMLRCLVGYKTVKNGAPVFEKEGLPKLPYDIRVEFKQR